MDFIKLARDRYSLKKFDGRKVPQAELNLILEAGRLSPTAKNLQNYKIYVAESDQALAKVDQVTPCRYGAGTVLLLTFEADQVFTYPGGKYDSGFEDTAIVATHIILAAKSMGVDSCWINNLDPDQVKEVFNLPANETVVCMVDLGFPAEGAGPLANHTKRKPIEDLVEFIQDIYQGNFKRNL